MEYDIITFGSAAQDIHVKSSAFKIFKELPKEAAERDFITGQGLCLALGSKIEVEDIVFATGGGGTNTAATFAKQGFKTAFCGGIGADASGLAIVRELKHLEIDTKFVIKKKDKHSNHSVIISNSDNASQQARDRTILVYRGASDVLTSADIPWKKIKNVKWFYLAPLTN